MKLNTSYIGSMCFFLGKRWWKILRKKNIFLSFLSYLHLTIWRRKSSVKLLSSVFNILTDLSRFLNWQPHTTSLTYKTFLSFIHIHTCWIHMKQQRNYVLCEYNFYPFLQITYWIRYKSLRIMQKRWTTLVTILQLYFCERPSHEIQSWDQFNWNLRCADDKSLMSFNCHQNLI